LSDLGSSSLGGDASASEKRTTRDVVLGRRYVSVAGLKAVLGVSRSKILRLERAGVITKPAPIPRGSKLMRWRRAEDVQTLAEILEHGGELDWSVLNGDGGGERRPWADFARPGRRRARQQVDVGDDDEEWISPAEEWSGGPIRVDPPRKVERRPACNGELVWDRDVPSCANDGVVDLRLPEPTEGTYANMARNLLISSGLGLITGLFLVGFGLTVDSESIQPAILVSAITFVCLILSYLRYLQVSRYVNRQFGPNS
jgi:predicted DNA-binding transcriptional regulator AlpA